MPWLLDLMRGPAPGAASPNGKAGFSPFREGGRNDSLHRMGRSMCAKYDLSEAELLIMLGAVNQARCQPPIYDDELRKIAHNCAIQPNAAGFEALTENQRIAADLLHLERTDPIAFGIEKRKIAEQKGCGVRDIQKAVEHLKRFEHSNSTGPNPTETGTSDCTNGCSNSGPVRMPEELYATAKTIIEAPDVLAEVDKAIAATGYAGDREPVLLIYVAVTSRRQEKPINVHVIAQAASGKNFAVNTALLFVPDEAVIKLTASSPKAFIHSEYDLKHKTIILAEADSLFQLEGNAATLVRSIVEDNRTDFDVVERNSETGRSTVRRVSKEGPTGIVTTGVKDLEFQMGTRMLTVHLSDSADQTRKVLQAEATIAEGTASAPDLDLIARFQDFQRWLAAQETQRVIVPYASILAAEVPAKEVRMRRDFKQLIAIIKAIALLNQQHRERTDQGAIVAELADYEWARELILSAFRAIAAGGITDAVRETCLAVPEDGDGVSEAHLAQALSLSRSTISYRVRRALKRGWLTNSERRRGYPLRLLRGPLPEDVSPLPTIDELRDALGCPDRPGFNSHNSQNSHDGDVPSGDVPHKNGAKTQTFRLTTEEPDTAPEAFSAVDGCLDKPEREEF